MFIDIFVLIVVLISILISFIRGFIREVLTIFGIGGGIVASYALGPLLSPIMRGWMGIGDNSAPEKLFDIIPYTLLADILSYGAVLIVFLLIFSVISHFLAEFVKNLGLGALDRTLGIIFGFVRGVLVLGLMYLPFFYLIGDEQKNEWFDGSKTHIYLEASSGFISGFIPESTSDNMKESGDIVLDISETRKKLEDMDILGNTESVNDNPSEEKDLNSENKDGYSPEFRQNMQDLFNKSSEL